MNPDFDLELGGLLGLRRAGRGRGGGRSERAAGGAFGRVGDLRHFAVELAFAEGIDFQTGGLPQGDEDDVDPGACE